MRRIALISIGLAATLLLSGCGTDSSSTESGSPSEQTSHTSAAATSESAKKIPAEYQAALNKADSYARTMSMSKRGIIEVRIRRKFFAKSCLLGSNTFVRH